MYVDIFKASNEKETYTPNIPEQLAGLRAE